MDLSNTKLCHSGLDPESIQSYFTFFDNRALILSALPFLMTPFLAARSTAEKALLRVSTVSKSLKDSIAVFALVLVALLKIVFFLSALSFFMADLVIGMTLF